MSWSLVKQPLTLIALAAALLLDACGGGVGVTANAPPVAGSVSGLLAGNSVQLQDNGGDTLTLFANGAFRFATQLANGASYAVTVLAQPTNENCVVTNGTGIVGTSNLINVLVTCSPDSYSVSGTLSGLLAGRSVVLEDNGGNATTLNANGTFTFTTPVASGANYSVTVATQPSGQTCSITNGSGVIGASNVDDVTVDCSGNTYNVIANVSGITIGGLILEDDGGNPLSINANGSFKFATPLASGSHYAVAVSTQATGETCVVTNGSGVIAAANVTVTVVCTPNKYTIGGTLGGLLPGNSVVVQDNGGNTTTLNANGNFTFSAPVVSGAGYAVTVLTSPAGQTCAVSNGSGKVVGANVTNVAVTCTPLDYTIGVTVTGLVVGQTGLSLQDNGGDNLSIPGNGTYNFNTPLASGSTYSVTILSQPAGGHCDVINGTGKVGSANVDVAVTCGTLSYTIGGTVTGLLTGNSVVLQDNGLTSPGNEVTVTATSSSPVAFTFGATVPSGSPYAVTVLTSPPGETCAVIANGSGTVGAANVTNVAVTCTPIRYTIGGTLTGLIGAGPIVLQDNGGDNLTLTSNGGFTFVTPVASGSPYFVTVFIQPTGQVCAVNKGSGIVAAANVTNVEVICRGWIWEAGDNATNGYGTYGAQPPPPSAGVPGARTNAVSWTDTGGNLWLFGGVGLDVNSGLNGNPADPPGYLNDLWEYSTTNGQWTWVSGSSSTYAFGDYGIQGTPAMFTVPGARVFASSWVDSQGNLWLFGGSGVDANGNIGDLNDLWEYSIATGQWTWVSGPACECVNQAGIYGPPGVGSTGYAPGSRVYAITWIDASGNFWLFGGNGEDSTGTTGELNDLWEFTPTNMQWTFVSGSTVVNQTAVYGTRGSPAAGNVPGARDGAVGWKDATGNFWLFGGYGPVAGGATGDLNDLWEYSTVTGLWTYISGSEGLNAQGVYGTPGILAPGNVPGARDDSTAWADSSGNLWLFGGSGYDSTGAFGPLNDLWLFSPTPTPGAWVFIGDSTTINALGNYGALGIAAPANVPGARLGASGWTDLNNNFWLFGGFGYDSLGEGYLNDLWLYTP